MGAKKELTFKDSPDKEDSSDKNKAKKEVLADSSDEEEAQASKKDKSKKETPKKETPKKETPKKETPKKAENSKEKKAKKEVLADSSDDEETQAPKDTTEINGKVESEVEEVNSED